MLHNKVVAWMFLVVMVLGFHAPLWAQGLGEECSEERLGPRISKLGRQGPELLKHLQPGVQADAHRERHG